MSQVDKIEGDEQGISDRSDEPEPIVASDSQAGTPGPGSNRSTWVGLVVGLLGGCCIILIVIGLFLSRLGFPGITGLFATPTPLPILGIDTPVIVNGLEIKVTSAQFEESYKSIDKTFRASKTGEILLVVKGFCPKSDLGATKNWKVTVSDELGNSKPSSITVTTTKDDRLELTWVFAVSKNSNVFTLHLPENQTIDLSNILNK
jgi:hypothetical protein